VYPLRAAHGGRTGRGYGIWPLSGLNAQVCVQWHAMSATQTHVEAGIPDELPDNWEDIDLLDTYGLYYCVHCERVVGEKGRLTLSEETIEYHRHGQAETGLKEINVDEAHGGYQLVVECREGRRGRSLLDIYDE